MYNQIAIIMKLIEVDDELSFYIPLSIVEGKEQENDIFVVGDGYKLAHIKNATDETDYYYYYPIEKSDLMDRYEVDDYSEFKLCAEVFLEEIKDYIHIGIKKKNIKKFDIYTTPKKNFELIFKNPIYTNAFGKETFQITEEGFSFLLECNTIEEIKEYFKKRKEELIKFRKLSEEKGLAEIEFDSEGSISKIEAKNNIEVSSPNINISNKSNKKYRIDIDVEELEAYLKERIIGQDDNLKGIINTIAMNYKTTNPKEIKKSLIIGPSGCGKTETFKVIAEYLKVPYTNYSAPDLTAAGYVGKDIQDLLKTIYENANKNIEKAKNSIVFIDEVDKISSKGTSSDNSVNPQASLLKFLEGHTYDVETSLRQYIKLDTGLMSIFCGGAFENIELEKNRKQIGYGNNIQIPDKKTITNKDLENYGMKKELIGRLPLQYIFDKLTKEDLKNILLTSKISPLLIEKARIARDLNVELIYDDAYINKIINNALLLNTGARSLKGEVDKSLELAEFELQKKSNQGKYKKLIVSEETVNNNKVYTLKK